jgi:imidazolonepropionase-like amidohydrolase
MTVVNGGLDELLNWPTPIEMMPEELIEAIVSHSIPVVSGFSAAAPQEGDLRRFLDAGGTLVYGTLAPNTGAKPVDEFRIMQLAGMTPMEMIESATANAANALEMGDVIGTLEVGKRADVIVLDGNIFDDNFLDTITSVVYVVKNGELVIQPE